MLLARLLVLLGIISVLFLSPSISRGLEGFRFTLLPVLFLALGLVLDLSDEEKEKLTLTYVIIAGGVAAWAIVERFLPVNYLQLWQIIAPDSNFGYGAHKVVAVFQSASVIGGPNQLATYVIPAFFILSFDRALQPILRSIFSALLLVAIFLTLSRSAIIGFAFALGLGLILTSKRKWIPATASAVVLLAGWYSWHSITPAENRFVSDLLTHGASQSSHQLALQGSVTEIRSRLSEPIRLVFGSGLGTAGPIALKYGDGIISESWYLQVLFELGILGLLGWLGMVAALVVKLWQKRQGLVLGLIAVSIAALFLHTWADNPAMAITLFILLGTWINYGKINQASISQMTKS